MEYQHSPVAMSLRHDVLESQVVLQYSLAYMNATAAIHANAQADVQKGSANVNKMYATALHLVPYLAVARSDKDDDTQERTQLVAEFKRMQRQELTNGKR